MCTAIIPARSAGSTSLSTRSPTYATEPRSAAAPAATRSKNSGAGFSTPQTAEIPIRSNGKQAPQEFLGGGRLVRRDADDVAGLAQTREAVHRVRIEIRRLPLDRHVRIIDAENR